MPPAPSSISRKVTFVVWGTCLIILAAATLGLLAYESTTRAPRARAQLGPLADLIAAATATHVLLNQPETVGAFLQSLRTNPSILEAHIRRPGSDSVFQSYPGGPGTTPPTAKPDGLYFHGDLVEFVKTFHAPGPTRAVAGHLHLLTRRSLLDDPTRQIMLVLAAVMVVVMLATSTQSYLLRRAVTRPLATLAHIADAIRQDSRSHLRAPTGNQDEIGRLGQQFNDMLDSLQQRDTKLQGLVRELEAKNAELERFTYTVSHDLKSPLITIKGFAADLLKDVANGHTQRLNPDLRRISDAAETMTQLLNNLLELSRVGRMVNPLREIPLDQLVRQVLELLAGPLAHRQVGVHLQPDLPTVLADPQRLMQVYQNLIENALKFMGSQPQPRIEIGSRPDPQNPILFVRDNGIGIEPPYHETVFGLFNQLDPKSTGTGLGLALARRIIEVHGGRMWVESPGANQGTTLCFTLPTPHRPPP